MGHGGGIKNEDVRILPRVFARWQEFWCWLLTIFSAHFPLEGLSDFSIYLLSPA